MPQCRPADRLGLNVGVGDLEGHPDRERQVGEVGVVGRAGAVEVDSPGGARVVEPRVLQGEHRMDERPGNEHGTKSEACQQVLPVSAGTAGPEQNHPDGDQAGDRRAEYHQVSLVTAGIFPSGVGLGRLRVELPYRGPQPAAVDERQDVPSDQRRCAARASNRGDRTAGDGRAERHKQFRPGRRGFPGGRAVVRGFMWHGTRMTALFMRALASRISLGRDRITGD